MFNCLYSNISALKLEYLGDTNRSESEWGSSGSYWKPYPILNAPLETVNTN